MDGREALIHAIEGAMITDIGSYVDQIRLILRAQGYDVLPYEQPAPPPFDAEAERVKMAELSANIRHLREGDRTN